MKNKVTTAYSLTAKYMLYTLLLVSPLLRGSVLGWQKSMVTVIALLVVAVLFLEQGIAGVSRWRKTGFEKPLLALLLVTAVSCFFSKSQADSLDGVTLLISYVAVFYATINCIRTRYDQREFMYLLCSIALLVCCIGFLKYGGLVPDIWQYDPQSENIRMTSTYRNPDHLAGYLEMIIPCFLALLLTRTRRGFWKAGIISLAVFLVISHIITMSRGGWAALAVALCCMTAFLLQHRQFHRKKMLLLVFLSCGTVALFVLSGSSLFERALSLTEGDTVLGLGGRIQIWQGVLPMIREHLLLGIGPGTFASVFPQYQMPGTTVQFHFAHNDYLHWISELGILFVPVLVWALFVCRRVAVGKLDSDSRQTWGFTLGAVCGIIAVLVHSFVDFNLHIPANAILFTVLLAIVAGGPLRKSEIGDKA